MRRALHIIYIGIALWLCLTKAYAQQERNKAVAWSAEYGWEYTVKAGLNVGGTSPLPLPREIRSIDSYNPMLCISLEGDIKKWLGTERRWGMMLGLRLENKGMETKATVKNYGMEIIGNGGEKLRGNWTGGVQTKVENAYFTVPLTALYQLNQRVSFSAGPYFSVATNRGFSGYVYEGYLREINPTGTKVEFSGDNQASYDFSNDVRKFQWGLQAGMEWRAFQHLIVFADLTWGLNDIFQSDFDTITFGMYPIYLNVGFGYAF
ncbi:MAG: PorT family protein [Parabacteroides sp.]|nr:PorT family protein [Parabacteroides sp.]